MRIPRIAISPGSEPLQEGTYSPEMALSNLLTFIMDLEHIQNLKATDPRVDPEADNDDGRFGFLIDVDGVAVTVGMPGWPLDEVRYLAHDDQDIWDFPRLWVDGSSWLWNYALSAVESTVERANE